MERNTILAIVLSLALVIGVLFLQNSMFQPQPPEQTKAKVDNTEKTDTKEKNEKTEER